MKLLITGDFCPINRASDAQLCENIFAPSLLEIIGQADYAITNLECPLTGASKPIAKTGPALKAKAASVAILKQNGFNVATLANNHIMDYGEEGLKETIRILDHHQIAHLGAGKSDESFETLYLTKDNLTIALINICENEWSTRPHHKYKAAGLDLVRNFKAIQTARSQADKVVLIHHGGHETYQLPTPRMKELFHFFIDAGADAVINHHTHCFSGFETYKNAPIFYSLGNFVFDSPVHKDDNWNYGMLLNLKIDKNKIDFDFKLVEQFNHQPCVKLLETNHELYGKISILNEAIQNPEILEDKFAQFVETKKKLYNSYLEPYRNKYRTALKNRGILPSAWHSRKRLLLKNLISCESHREIVLNLLENEIGNPQ